MADDDHVVRMPSLGWQLVPVPPEACQVCGRNPAHDPEDPHDATSLYYQYRYYLDQGSWPTWKTAMAHCSPEKKAAWEAELRRRGAWTE